MENILSDSSAYFILIIVVIYLIGLLLKRRKKMPNEPRALGVSELILIGWIGIFFGIWAISPLSDLVKILVDVFVSAFCVASEVLYLVAEGKIPSPNPELARKIDFWFSTIILLLISGMSFFLNYAFWKTSIVTINGVDVITYDDLFSLLYGAMGVVAIIFVIRYIRRRNPYKKITPKKG